MSIVTLNHATLEVAVADIERRAKHHAANMLPVVDVLMPLIAHCAVEVSGRLMASGRYGNQVRFVTNNSNVYCLGTRRNAQHDYSLVIKRDNQQGPEVAVIAGNRLNEIVAVVNSLLAD